MNKLKKIVNTILDIEEIYIPSILFAVVFVLYLAMICFRYILNWKIAPIYELCQVLYLECAMLAASYGGRTDKHVIFPLLYDRVPPRVKIIFRLIADVFVAVLSAILICPAWESVSFIARKKTSVLKIPFSIVYLPFLIFVVLSTFYYIANFVKDLKIFMGKTEEKEGKK
ncbi:MAG: TRAP transporter small permease [Blautia sp.]|nr:TRAP transporter small permease [Blautia sp.]